ncbi:MAG: ABC transporter ATP-binding protein [Ardenticatenales bacterium]|nr:ABC transporter ATP-binding protein [Ardenticatenales bacterium]
MQAIAAQHEEKTERLRIALSDKGQVLLRLAQPVLFRFWPNGGGAATSILLNVDDPERFLSALALPEEVIRQIPTFQQERKADSPRTPLAFPPPDSAPLALHSEGLHRQFGGFAAVRDLSLAIRRGEIYGFLGANGAGKTTTIKMLVGLLEPSAGRIFLAGHDVWAAPLAAKAALGYVPDSAILYERLSAREFLAFLGHLRGLPADESRARAESLLAVLDLTGRADEPCGSFSYGMKRKLSLAGALLHQPAVLILDEPLNGLDPRSARRVKDLFLELAAGGTTIFLSTHDLATAESVCDRVGIMHQGQLLAEGRADEVRQLTNAPDLEAAFLALTAEQEVAA